MNFTALPRCILLALHTPLSKAFAVGAVSGTTRPAQSETGSREVSSNRVGVTTRSPRWAGLFLALALSGCDVHLSCGFESHGSVADAGLEVRHG